MTSRRRAGKLYVPSGGPPPGGISLTLLANAISATTEPYSTTSVSPTAGAVLFLHVSCSASGGVGFLTPSGLGGTWNSVASSTWGSRRTTHLYYCDNWSGSGTISIDYNAGSFQAGGYGLIEVTGLDAAIYDGVGTAVISGTTGNPTVTGSNAAGDVTLSVISIENNEALSHDAGWTELYDQGEGNGVRRMGMAWDTDADSTPSWSWASSASGWGCSLRLKAA
jgi:hypothetical protein